MRLSLAGWDTDRPLAQWITDQVVSTYRFSRAAAETLVEGGLILPVLDGLDEMDTESDPGYSSRAGRALRALNRYQQGLGKAPVVVTCRSGPYGALEGLSVWAHDAARVEISPRDADAVRWFLADRAVDPARWRPVSEALVAAPQGPLAAGLSTPWRLTLAVTVYDQRRPDDGSYCRDPGVLAGPALSTADAVGEHLLNLFIPAVTAVRPGPGYSAHEVRTWLTVLARYLEDNAAGERGVGGRVLSGTDIVLHELWPLGGNRGPRVVSTAVVAAAGLAAATAVISQAPARVDQIHLVGSAGLAAFAVSVVWADLWPDPGRTDLKGLRTRDGRRQLAYGLAAGIVTGIAGGLAFGIAGGIALGMAAALTSGLVGIVTYALMARLDTSGMAGAVNPKNIVRNNLVAGLATGLVFGPAFGLAAGLTAGPAAAVACGLAAGFATARQFGPTAGLGFGLTASLMFDTVGGLRSGLTGGPAFGLVGGLAAGAAGLRYVGLLACTRKGTDRWLPWRLGRFLAWCYDAGLIRIAGVAYQFRHRELQDFLARRPSKVE